MNLDDYRLMQAKAMTEKQLQELIITLAKQLGWMHYHVFDSRRSEPGFPDLVLLRPERGRLLWRELKTEKGRTTAAQDRWIRGLADAGQDVEIWTPIDWVGGRIERELRGR